MKKAGIAWLISLLFLAGLFMVGCSDEQSAEKKQA